MNHDCYSSAFRSSSPLKSLLCHFFSGVKRLQDLLDKARLWECSRKLNTVIDDGLRYSLNPVALSEINELRDFDHIGSNMLVFDCQLVGQPGR